MTTSAAANPAPPGSSAFSRLPRAARWLLYTGLLLIAYFAVIEPALDARNRFAAEADALQRDLDELRAYTAGGSDTGATRDLILAHYGDPAPPAAPNEYGRPADFETAVNEIFRTHAVRKDQTERRSVINIPQEAGIVGEDQTLQRQELTLTFEAPPHTISQIIADLEAEPLVSSITRIRLDKSAARRSESSESGLVKATIGVETWMIVDRQTGLAAAGAAR